MATVLTKITCPAGTYTQLSAATDVNTKVRVKTMAATTQVRLAVSASPSANDFIQLSDRKWFDVESASTLFAMPIGSSAVIEVAKGT